MSLPVISIVTPVFNACPFTEAAIQSVLKQDYPHVEYIVIDGGSTDGTREIIEKYSRHLAYWESAPDRGQTHALNKGFARSTGTLRGWLNADEEYLPGALRCVAKHFNPSEPYQLIYGDRYCVDLEADPSRRLLQKTPPLSPFAYMFYAGRTLFSDATFWTKDIHDALGSLDEEFQHYAMDVDWLLRVSSIARTWKRVEQPLSLFKHHRLRKTEEAIARNIRLNEYIRRRYAQRAGISTLRLALGWLWYGVQLRVMETGIKGICALPKWDTIKYLFLNQQTRMFR